MNNLWWISQNYKDKLATLNEMNSENWKFVKRVIIEPALARSMC